MNVVILENEKNSQELVDILKKVAHILQLKGKNAVLTVVYHEGGIREIKKEEKVDLKNG